MTTYLNFHVTHSNLSPTLFSLIARENLSAHHIKMSKECLLPENPGSLRVGCIGGGQLGRMMALEAPRINIQMFFLDPAGGDAPAAFAAGVKSESLKGKLNDETKIRELASKCDVMTCEIEHIGTDVLEKLESEGVNVQPSGRVVKIIQDKFIQKVSAIMRDWSRL